MSPSGRGHEARATDRRRYCFARLLRCTPVNEFQDSSADQRLSGDDGNADDPLRKPQSALAAATGNEYLTRSSQSFINDPISDGHPIGIGIRVLLVLWSLFLCAGFVLAASMSPDPRGFGTHQSLGFPPCTFQVLFDIPCPSCGMTTSFAHFTRGQIAASARANIAGLLLAITCLIQIPWCWISALKGRLWRVHQPVNLTLFVVGGISIVAVIIWCRQIY
jgi:hypothetical protein